MVLTLLSPDIEWGDFFFKELAQYLQEVCDKFFLWVALLSENVIFPHDPFPALPVTSAWTWKSTKPGLRNFTR